MDSTPGWRPDLEPPDGLNTYRVRMVYQSIGITASSSQTPRSSSSENTGGQNGAETIIGSVALTTTWRRTCWLQGGTNSGFLGG